MSNKLGGFNTMAVALAAAGLVRDIGASAAAAAVVHAEPIKFLLIEHYKCRRWAKSLGNGRFAYFSDDGYYSNKTSDPDIQVIECLYAADWNSIGIENLKKQTAWMEGGTSGWLSPEGMFYSCKYGGHGALATHVLHKDWYDLERDGWCHVDCAGEPGKDTFRMGSMEIKPTPAQEAWLVANGHDLDPHGYKQKKEMPKIGWGGVDMNADKAAFERMMAAAPKR